MKIWQLQEAKAKFSQLIRDVLANGPQGVSIRGLFQIVIISRCDYEKILFARKNKYSFNEFIDKSPLKGLDLDFSRNKSLNREIEL